MKILIIGAAGFLGNKLFRDFSKENEVLGVDKKVGIEGVSHLDLVQREQVKDVFLRFGPEVVLLPAAISAVDYIEGNQDLAWRVNVEAVKDVAVFSKKQGAFLVFYSTDYIFDGKKGPYSEEDKPNPLNFYGKTKLEAEKSITKELKTFLIVRTCGLYGYEKDGKNYAMQVLNALREKRIFKALYDQYGTPTYVEDLSNITLELVRNKKDGIFNVVGKDYVNRIQLSEEIAKVFGLDKNLINSVSSEELGQVAQRPKKGGLRIDKLKAELEIIPMSLREGLLAMKERLDKDK